MKTYVENIVQWIIPISQALTMPSFKQTLAAMLRNYPNVHPEPIDAMVRMMTSHGSWENGAIVVDGMELDSPMDYSDLVVREHDSFTTRIQKRAQTFQRKLIDSQMDGIVENATTLYFRQSYHRTSSLSQLLGGTYNRQAAFLSFPDDIQKDWGQAVLEFQDWLEQDMRNFHMVQISRDENDDGTSHWPDKAKALAKDIQTARRALFPIVHGKDYDQHIQERNELAEQILGDLLKPTSTKKAIKP